jgi:outer membrane protein TolC
MKYWHKVMPMMSVLMGVSSAGYAQSLTLTIEELFQQVEKKNSEVQLARKDVNISSLRERAEKDNALPDVGISLEGDFIGNTYVLNRDFSHAMRTDMSHWGNAFSVSVKQPVYTGGELTAKNRKAETQTLLSENTAMQVEDRMKMCIVECYLELFKNRNLLSVYDENIRITGELIEEMNARANQGLVLGNDVTRYELTLSNLRYDRLAVVNSIKNLNYNLINYLHLTNCDSIVPTIDLVRINLSAAPLSEWMATSRQEAPVLKKYDLLVQENAAQEKLIKSETLPKIGVNAGASMTAPITTHTPVLNKNSARWFVGLNLSFNPSAFYKTTHRMQAVRLENERHREARTAQEESNDRSLDRAYKSYIEAIEHVTTQKKNVELASENYRIVERRYNNDLSLLTDMLDASASKLDAEMRLVNAQVDVLYYYFQLKYLSGTI